MLQTHPALSCNNASSWEDAVLGKDEVKIWTAMTRAGETIAASVLRDYLETRPLPCDNFRVLILCGTGHNAGDALVAARKILQKLPQASALAVLAYGDGNLRPLARRALDEFSSIGNRAKVADWSEVSHNISSESFNLCIEGVVGMQMRPPLREPAPEIFAAVAKMDIELRAAVDLPAGLGDESTPDGFTADFTYATGIVKTPLLHHENVVRAGRVRYLDLGFFDKTRPEETSKREILLPSSLRSLRALRNAATDKRSFGHLFLLGGSRTMPGAISMATMTAVRAGAGLTTALVPANFSTRLVPMAPEAMWISLPIDSEGNLQTEESLRIARRATEKATALVIGPGLDAMNRDTRALICRIIRELPIPMVLDAGAVFPEAATAASARSQSAPKVIFTPHMGEFARMAGDSVLDDGFDIDAKLMEFTARTRSIVVLKGPITRICDGTRIICDTLGGPVLARGGSGDVLSGIIGALIARPEADVLESVCQATIWHGLAAEHLARERGQQAVRTTELLDHLSPALREA